MPTSHRNSVLVALLSISCSNKSPSHVTQEPDARPPSVSRLEALAIATGNSFTCALLANGQVVCWGKMTARPAVAGATSIAAGGNQACVIQAHGVGCWKESGVVRAIAGLETATSIGVSGTRACAVLANGSARCDDGLLLGDATQVAVGDPAVCVRRPSGRVACWGGGDSGREVAGIEHAVDVAAASDRACAVTKDGGVWCWSVVNDDGPAQIAGPGDAVSVAVNREHACVVRRSGQVSCWGTGSLGQLGQGKPESTRQMVGVASVENATHVATGGGHSCALASNGHVWCWGFNHSGEVTGRLTGTPGSPVDVVGVLGAVAVACGRRHTCALRDQRVICWGDDSAGQLSGTGTAGTQIAAGGDRTCVLDGGKVRCWGRARYLGEGESAATVVDGVANPVTISVGGEHACVLDGAGKGTCWGGNEAAEIDSQLGSSQRQPVRLSTPRDLLAIAAGSAGTCGLARDGDVWCWGEGFRSTANPIGPQPPAELHAPLTPHVLQHGASAISLGSGTACAVVDGEIHCWDRYSFQRPVAVGKVRRIAAGEAQSCAIEDTGRVVCWRPADPLPRPIGIEHARDLCASEAHACAIRADGGVACWGDNTYGELGNGESAVVLTPAVVPALP
jgi:alpha-tubulin suppressor-like RCC1 family protein